MAEWRGSGCGERWQRNDSRERELSQRAVRRARPGGAAPLLQRAALGGRDARGAPLAPPRPPARRSEEHTAELRSHSHPACRLLPPHNTHPSPPTTPPPPPPTPPTL